MTQPQSGNDVLMGGGSPALKFETIGTSHTGTVAAEPTAVQQKDFRTQQPEFWNDGSPKMQVVVQLSTQLRDPQKPEDDGTRSLYIKGKELTNAIRNAVRATGANGIHTGGTLTVQYAGDGQAQNGNNPPKLYAASYQPPAVSFAGITAPTQQQAQPAVPQQAPVQQQYQPVMPQAPAPVGAPVAAAPPGVDPAMWARLTPAQQQAVTAASAAQQGQPAF